MADIDVVKKGSNTWLWIVLALAVVAVIVWFAMSRGGSPQTKRIGQTHQPLSGLMVLTSHA